MNDMYHKSPTGPPTESQVNYALALLANLYTTIKDLPEDIKRLHKKFYSKEPGEGRDYVRGVFEKQTKQDLSYLIGRFTKYKHGVHRRKRIRRRSRKTGIDWGQWE